MQPANNYITIIIYSWVKTSWALNGLTPWQRGHVATFLHDYGAVNNLNDIDLLVIFVLDCVDFINLS